MLMVSVATLGAFALMPAAHAETASSNETTGAVVDFADGPTNAAAAVLVTYDESEVTSLSASSAFGADGAAASATSIEAASVGSAVGNGTILAGEVSFQNGLDVGGIFVNFGDSLFDEGR